MEIIVVFGSSLKNNKLTDEAIDRLDYAIAHYNNRLKASENIENPNIIFIVSGGGKSKITEAQRMAEYLIDAGIDQDKVILETSSANTIENVIYTSNIIRNLIADGHTVKSITYVSSEYHLDRIIKIIEVFGVENVELFAVGSQNYPKWREENEETLKKLLPAAIQKYL